MTTVSDPTTTGVGAGVAKWLRMYRQMMAIRLFEENVNELYTRALMPGLAHLYIGEEAIAVGVCEVLRADDYITSTHRGHGHCLAKGASPKLMFAELLGKEAGYCRGKGERHRCGKRRTSHRRSAFRENLKNGTSRGLFFR
jgi:TPP-dependent pyruvate/acetoin dehydrogenase alpha subunit